MLLVVGFILWFNWELYPTIGVGHLDQTAPDSLTQILFATVPPFVIGILLILGGYLLLVQKKIGWYISALSLPLLLFHFFALHLIAESKFFLAFFEVFAPDPRWISIFGEAFLSAVFIGMMLCLVIGRKHLNW